MIKFLIAFAAPESVSREGAIHHYRYKHGPLVASVPEFRAETRAYLQNVVIDGAEAHIGVSELWFDDWERYDAAFSCAPYLAEIRPDEGRFADLSSALVAFAQDQTLFGGGELPSFKLFRFWETKPEAKGDTFKARWRDYGAVLAADEALRAVATGYVRNEGVDPLENPFPLARAFDGIDEFWIDDPSHAQAILDLSNHYAQKHGIACCLSAGQLGAMTTRTYRIV